MVVTRSMHAKMIKDSYINTYDPNKRISLFCKENLRNQSISIFEMFDIYNDIRYKAKRNGGIILDEDLNPLLFATTGIFRNYMLSTKLKIKKLISDSKLMKVKQKLNTLLENIHNVDIGIRQTSVNCGFGDLDRDNEVIKNFNNDEINSIFERVLTPQDIKYMNLFEYILKDYKEYIDIIENFVKNNPIYEYHFLTELCANNFIEGSIYSYVSNLKISC
jgi:hypothetical protein